MSQRGKYRDSSEGAQYRKRTRSFITEGRIAFGKHAGRSVEDVRRSDPSYLEWAAECIPGFGAAISASSPLKAPSSTPARKYRLEPPKAKSVYTTPPDPHMHLDSEFDVSEANNMEDVPW